MSAPPPPIELYVYRVHRSKPEKCPKPDCKRPLKEEGKDYTRILGAMKRGEMHVNTERIIECANPQCRNQTLQLIIEDWQVIHRSDAEKLCLTGEYWNLRRLKIMADFASNRRTIYLDRPIVYAQTPAFNRETGQLLPTITDPADLWNRRISMG